MPQAPSWTQLWVLRSGVPPALKKQKISITRTANEAWRGEAAEVEYVWPVLLEQLERLSHDRFHRSFYTPSGKELIDASNGHLPSSISQAVYQLCAVGSHSIFGMYGSTRLQRELLPQSLSTCHQQTACYLS